MRRRRIWSEGNRRIIASLRKRICLPGSTIRIWSRFSTWPASRLATKIVSAIDGFEIIRFVRVTGIASSGDALGFDEFPAAIGQEGRNPLRKSEQMGPKVGFASAARRILA